MIRTVLLFARARDLAGQEQVDVELPSGGTVRQLRTALVETVPALETVARSLLIAINNEYAADEALVPEAGEIACFPPVSGG